MRYARQFLLLILGAILIAGCNEASDDRHVVLYTSLNEPTARSVISIFESRTGIRVELRADSERDKTVGLVRTLLEERERPRADVFWNSETAHTVRLKHAGVLAPMEPAPINAQGIPAHFRDPEGFWFGFAGRARVLIVNTNRVSPERMPNSMWDLIDPAWQGRAGLVRPVTGTTLTHMTALATILPPLEWQRFMDGIVSNQCALPPGNARLAQLVGDGEIDFGFTDSSDYRLVKGQGKPVTAVYPDQGVDGIGTLLIPNTVALVKNGPNPENARKLIDFLLSDEAEEILASHPRGHTPLKPGIEQPSGFPALNEIRTMAVDFDAIGLLVEEHLDAFDRHFP